MRRMISLTDTARCGSTPHPCISQTVASPLIAASCQIVVCVAGICHHTTIVIVIPMHLSIGNVSWVTTVYLCHGENLTHIKTKG